MDRPLLITCLAGLACALGGSFLATLTDRKDRQHYYKTYFWVEFGDGIYFVAGFGLLAASVSSVTALGRADSDAPAGRAGLIVLAAIAVLIAVLGGLVFQRSSRIVVPSLLTGGSVGAAVLALAGLLGLHGQDLVDTGALGWVVGLGGTVVVGVVSLFFVDGI
ncbi:hypothetical protein ABZX12_03690 [Kribbella sp. NPDC003505]|uniref:hypothetical protein n=1 Tax=Kribbella sp. NPDC003505 TaxID=3154448 RepID=UPI0033B75B17